MTPDLEQRALRAIRGERGVGCALVRGALGAMEPLYRAAVASRNRFYDFAGQTRLPRPVISVGNITTGGTGKTPMVAWLATQLLEQGMHPAILLRGYSRGGISDEQQMLQRQLPGVPVQANADRVEGARMVLGEHPEVDVFLLDDGFQHRRVARDFDLVLINAREPFGLGRVLPRGLLRESLDGLKRAHGFVITRAD